MSKQTIPIHQFSIRSELEKHIKIISANVVYEWYAVLFILLVTLKIIVPGT